MGTLTKLKADAIRRLDGWVNMFTGLGEALSDKTAQTHIRRKHCQPQYYEDLFHEDALARRVLELPAREMVRKGFELKTNDPQFDDSAVMHAWRTLPVQGIMPEVGLDVAFVRATALARATGGAAIVLGVDDGAQSVESLLQPLNLDSVSELKWVRVVSRTSLTPRAWYPFGSDKYGQVMLWHVHYDAMTGGSAPANIIVHESRLVLFDGVWAIDRRRIENLGFGLSAYEQLEAGLAQLGTSFQALSTMIVDASQAVMKIKDLHGMVTMNDEGDAAIRKRLRLVDYSRSVAHAVALDADSEEFEYQNRQLTGIPDIVYAGMFWLSAQTSIPVTLLFGRSPAGLNATGDADIRFFYDSVAADQITYLKPRQQRVMQVIMRSKKGPLAGKEPATWDLEYCPLWGLSETDLAQVKLNTAQADQIYITSQVVTPEEVAIARFGGEKYSTDLTIDTDTRDLPGEPDGDEPNDPGSSPPSPKDSALAGQQVTSLVEIVKDVAAGDLPRDSALEIIKLSFGLDDATADAVLGEAGKSFKIEKPPPPVPPPAPGAPTPPNSQEPPNGPPKPSEGNSNGAA